MDEDGHGRDFLCDAQAAVGSGENQDIVFPLYRPRKAKSHHVLAAGGRGAIVSTDWKSLVRNGSSDQIMDRVLAAFAGHCPHQQLPRTLAPRLRAAGFVVEDRRVLPQFNPEFNENTFSSRLLPVVEGFVRSSGITQAEAAEWADGIRRCGQAGQYFFCLNQYLFQVSKP